MEGERLDFTWNGAPERVVREVEVDHVCEVHDVGWDGAGESVSPEVPGGQVINDDTEPAFHRDDEVFA